MFTLPVLIVRRLLTELCSVFRAIPTLVALRKNAKASPRRLKDSKCHKNFNRPYCSSSCRLMYLAPWWREIMLSPGALGKSVGRRGERRGTDLHCDDVVGQVRANGAGYAIVVKTIFALILPGVGGSMVCVLGAGSLFATDVRSLRSTGWQVASLQPDFGATDEPCAAAAIRGNYPPVVRPRSVAPRVRSPHVAPTLCSRHRRRGSLISNITYF